MSVVRCFRDAGELVDYVRQHGWPVGGLLELSEGDEPTACVSLREALAMHLACADFAFMFRRTPQTPELLTVGTIAERLGVKTHRVRHVIRSRGIRPAARCGGYRVFTEDDLQTVERELVRMAR